MCGETRIIGEGNYIATHAGVARFSGEDLAGQGKFFWLCDLSVMLESASNLTVEPHARYNFLTFMGATGFDRSLER